MKKSFKNKGKSKFNRKNTGATKININPWIYWIPRILSIIFILFLILMSLDVFDGSGFWQTILALLIHNIPTIILIIILIISWKREIVAGIAFILVGLLYIVSVVLRAAQSSFQSYMLLWILQISGIAFLMGILFLICWKKRNAQKNKKRKKR